MIYDLRQRLLSDQANKNSHLVWKTMDVSSLYIKIPQEEGTEIVCKEYDSFHKYNPPIPTHFLREILGLTLNKNWFQFNGETYLQTHGSEPPWELKWQYHLPIFSWLKLKQRWYNTAKSSQKNGDDWRYLLPLGQWKKKTWINYIEQANKFHPTIKFTAEISENEITFLDTVVFKAERLKKESTLDIKAHYKPTQTFQYSHFNSCHPPGVKNGSI